MPKNKLFMASFVVVTLLGAGVAQAQSLNHEGLPPTDPVIAWGEQLAPHNEFFLNSDKDVELIRFTSTRDNTVCVPQMRRDVTEGRKQTVGLKVSWDDTQAVIEPGRCLSFDAKSIKVKPAGPLPDDTVLVGTIRTTK